MKSGKSVSINRVKRLVSFLLIVSMGLGALVGLSASAEEAYASPVGTKNQQACDRCVAVSEGDTPTDSNGDPYDDVLGDGSVYRGGDAESGVIEGSTYSLDDDSNDFATPLPYGNVYVDTSMLGWGNPKNFIIDIKDKEHFAWVGVDDVVLTDSKGTTTINDPLKSGKPLKGGTLDDGSKKYGFIAYVGELKPYHEDIKDVPNSDGFTNVIESDPNDPDDYLYRITYLNAATLADGTRGNLVMTMKKVEIETSISVSEENPRILKDKNGDEYKYTKVVLPIQGANQMIVAGGVTDSEGNYVNEPNIVVKSRDEVRDAIEAANDANKATVNKNLIPTSGDSSYLDEKVIRNTIGGAYTFDIQVQDSEGNAATGTMAYAATDLDLPSYQTTWGRERGADPYMYAEGLELLYGTQSYALVPKYDHSDGTTIMNGWVPDGISGSLDNPLSITRVASGSNADGVRFASIGEKVLRDKNGLWKDVLFTGPVTGQSNPLHDQPTGTIMDFTWDNINNSRVRYKNLNELWATWVNDSQGKPHYKKTNIRRELAGKIPDGSGGYVPWDQITIQQIAEYFKGGSYSVERNDDGTYDSGFAVLLDPKKSTFRWTGSTYQTGSAVTKLFDTTLFTYIEQTHGTGGGIYFETYDIAGDCKVNRAEGTVTMGKGTDATITVVPEDGYRIDTIQVGKKGLDSPVAFTVIYDSAGKISGIKHQGLEIPFAVGSSLTIVDPTYGPVSFDANTGGSIDVTLPDMDDPRHIHADFTTDYYFYKVWKSKTQEPTSLKLTATPYAYKFKEVIIDGYKYTISGNTFTNTHDKKSYTLENNALKIGDDPDNMTVYYLEGNDLVSYTYDDPNDPSTRRVDERCTIRLEYEKNGNSVTFDVVKEDAVNPEETNVIATTDKDGYPVWQIRYPAAGYKTKEGKVWPALAVETTPSAHNINHVERNYWFVTEDAPGWALVEYDNSKAEAPGVIDAAKDRNEIYKVGTGKASEDTTTSNYSAWALTSTKDYQNSGAVIKHASSSNHAYMSVFSNHDNAITKHNNTWGGKIVNIPLVVVNAEKTWDDFSNAFETRQDVWFHIDATIDGTKTKDVLPPQKLAATESGDVQTKTWGNKTAYGDEYLKEYAETGVDYSKVKVVGTTSGLPADIYYAQDSANPNKFIPMVEDGYEEIGGVQVPKYKPNDEGIIYYVNELSGVNGDGKEIKYSLRETDAKGNELNKSDVGEYLIGYESEVSDVAKDEEQATLDEVKVDSYTGKVKNTLETVDYEVKKIWIENGATGDGRTHASDEDFTRDVEKLKDKYTLKENGETVTDTEALKLQPKTAAAYVPASGDTEASGTLETKKGADGTEIVFTWHKIPKYVGDTDGEGKAIVREALYSVVESPLSGYNAAVYDNSATDAEGKAGETAAAFNKGTITNEVTPPKGTPKQTWGEKDQPQSVTGKDMFKVTTETDISGDPNEIKEVKLIDPATGASVSSVTVPEGIYTVDADGKITFMPVTGFVGNPTPVGVRGIDANGLSADTTYTPHVCDTETTVKRTIVYEYSNGDPVLEDGKPKTVEQTVTFKGVLNPETGEITYPGNPTETFPEVPSDAIAGYTVDRQTVGAETVRPRDKDLFEKVIYSPGDVKATPDRTYGLPNEPQEGTVTFTMETENYTDGTPNTITMKLIDPKTGEEIDSKTVDAVDESGNTVGTYTLSDDGTVTFTPNKDYVGNPKPAEVTGTDRFGTKAKTTYTPHIVDPVTEDEASRTIYYTYLTEDGETASESITQKVTMKRHAKSVDPKTGEVLAWDDWEPQTFPAVPNPGHIDEDIWTANKSAQEATVTEPGPAEDVHVVYTKEPYTVVYVDGDHGTSDGNGDQSGEDYNNDVTGGNGVTPNKGYHFTGRYRYVITDKNGNVIDEGETDDPKSLKVTGNIVFTPLYEPDHYRINYDANGGTGTMDSQDFTGADDAANSKSNRFTRTGYSFKGFTAFVTDPATGEQVPLVGEDGEELLFTSVEDFMEYFYEYGDGAEVTLVAQWEPIPEPAPEKKPQPSKLVVPAREAKRVKAVNTADASMPALWIAGLCFGAYVLATRRAGRRRR